MTTLVPEGFSQGYIARDWKRRPLGSMPFSKPFPQEDIIQPEAWPDLIADMTRTKTRLSDIWEREINVVLNQNGLGYCHAFSPCMAVMLLRAVNNQPFQLLSASSIGGPVTGFKNQGAYIFNDLEQIVKHGVAPESMYPMTTASNKYWTKDVQEEAAKNKVEEWWEGENRSWKAVMTCLLSRIPVCVGYNWWGHAVTLVDPIWVNGRSGADGINSWSTTWTYGGARPGWFRFLEGYGQYRANPDEWYAPRSVMSNASARKTKQAV